MDVSEHEQKESDGHVRSCSANSWDLVDSDPHFITEEDLIGEEDSDYAISSTVNVSILSPISAVKSLFHRGLKLADNVRKHSGDIVDHVTSHPSIKLGGGTGVSSFGEQFDVNPKTGEISTRKVKPDSSSIKDDSWKRFGLPESERPLAWFYCYIMRLLPWYGKIFITEKHICFHNVFPGYKIKMILPIKDVEDITEEDSFRFAFHGLGINVNGNEGIFFEFGDKINREECFELISSRITPGKLQKSSNISQEMKANPEEEHKFYSFNDRAPELETEQNTSDTVPSLMFDSLGGSVLDFKPKETLRFTCLAIGSLGDVQPYIALCKGLMKDGHKTKIVTHAEFKDHVEAYGIEFAPVGGDPTELMRICVEHGMFTISFLKEVTTKFRGWLDGLFLSAWESCQDTDVLIESPSTMAGIHVAEALKIPYFRAFTMPWSRTRYYPHAFAVPGTNLGPAYNYYSYSLFDNIFWRAIAGQANRWRKNTLNLPPTSNRRLKPNRVPFLYNFSPSVVPRPKDWPEWIQITGYWFVSMEDNLAAKYWEPTMALLDFIAKAKKDHKPLVYVGFGSIVVSDSNSLTKITVEAIKKSKVRCILSKGWSERLKNQDQSGENEESLPDSMFTIDSIPHEWLFPKISVAVHHGGSGTTGATLRAGVPTIIKPFFGDQFFWASRVTALGVGISLNKMDVSHFADALVECTTNENIIKAASLLGEKIRAENGVENAINMIYRNMDYAKAIINVKSEKIRKAERNIEDDMDEQNSDESWTFIDDSINEELFGPPFFEASEQ